MKHRLPGTLAAFLWLTVTASAVTPVAPQITWCPWCPDATATRYDNATKWWDYKIDGSTTAYNTTVCQNLPIQTFSVESFSSSNGTDEQAIRSCLAAAIAASSNSTITKVNFSANKTYHLTSAFSSTVKASLLVENARQLWLQGNGATLLMDNLSVKPLSVKNSTRVYIDNFKIYNKLEPHMAGTVGNINTAGACFDLALAPGYTTDVVPLINDYIAAHTTTTTDPITGAVTTTVQKDVFGYLLDPVIAGRPKAGIVNFVWTKNVAIIGPNQVRITLFNSSDLASFVVGDRFVQLGRSAVPGGIGVSDTDEVTLHKLSFDSLGAGPFIATHGERTAALKCTVAIKSGRWSSAGADFFLSSLPRRGPWVEGCSVEGVSDDCVSIYTGNTAFSSFSGNVVTLKSKANAAYFKVNDLCRWIDPETQTRVDWAYVNGVNPDTGEITLSNPVPTDAISSGLLFQDVNFSTEFVVVGNKFKNSRAFGVRATSSDGIVTGNEFTGLCEVPVMLTFYEKSGGYMERISITDNVMDSCKYSTKEYLECASGGVALYPYGDQGAILAMHFPVFRSVSIKNNIFKNTRPPVINLSEIETAEVTGNTFVNVRNSCFNDKGCVGTGRVFVQTLGLKNFTFGNQTATNSDSLPMRTWPELPWRNDTIRVALPPGYENIDYTAKTITLTGSGSGIGRTSVENGVTTAFDCFQFFNFAQSGNLTFSAQVDSVENTNNAYTSQAGLMMRRDLYDDAPFAMICVSPNKSVTFMTRSGYGLIHAASSVGNISFPVKLKLVRSGTTISGYYYNTTNSTWIQVGNTTDIPEIPTTLNGASYWLRTGYAVSSNVPNIPCQAVFSNPSPTGTAFPSPSPSPQ